ncbi:MAG: menaquinone biosynthesis protein [Deltaproteobacteria bacterium]|nr:menaquinone biosynthesis protein [Deltaproteobacteria bacterium]
MIKLGAVPFLNVSPLVYALEEGLIKNDFEIVYENPSRLSSLLFERKVDLGLIPVAELLKRDIYRIVPKVSISSKGEVASVVLLSKKSVAEIKTVAVDLRSQSSSSLLRIILEIFKNIKPNYVQRNPDDNFLDGVDAGMYIGDAGLRIRYSPPSGYEVIDLGEVWTKETGLPFVYAVYAVGEGVHLGENLEALEMAKMTGLKLIKKIAKIYSETINLSEDICYRYLTQRIYYDLGDEEIEGINTFRELLSRIDGNIKNSDLKFY